MPAWATAGSGRLAACFIESLATLQYSAMGYGLRYEYGIFRQSIRDGYQVGGARQLAAAAGSLGDRPSRQGRIRCRCTPASSCRGAAITIIPNRPSTLLGIAYDRPVVGYGARCVNTLRLWAAAAPEHFDFAEFSQGDFVGAVIENVAAESLTRVLYPDDSTEAGRTPALPAAVLPGQLLAAGHPRRASTRSDGGRWVGAARPRGDSAERHASRAGGRRADADPARSGASRLGRGLGPHGPHARATPTTRCCPRRSRSGRSSSSSCSFRGTSRSSTRSTGASSTTSRARYPGDDDRRAAHEPDRGGAGAEGPHGASGRGRHAQHQRRRRDPLGAAADRACCATSPRCFRSGSTTRPTA